MKRLRLVLAGLVVAVAGCAGGGGGRGGGETVAVTLREWRIEVSPASVAAGRVTFEARNAGTLSHELVIVRTDAAPDALPVRNGKVEEDAPGLTVAGEIEEFAPGRTERGSFRLEAGSYVLICNIAGHYENGMRTAFRVT